MKFLALSGSARSGSTNTALLQALAAVAAPDDIDVFAQVHHLPVFSPDLEYAPLPAALLEFLSKLDGCDGLIVASPEYIHAIPGGLKNALDWLVSRDEIIGKPIAIIHGSPRGDDMLAQLRLVLSTVSAGFTPKIFARFSLLKQSPDQVRAQMDLPHNQQALVDFLAQFRAHCQAQSADS